MDRYILQTFCRVRRDSNLHEWKKVATANNKEDLKKMIPEKHKKDFRIIDFNKYLDAESADFSRMEQQIHVDFIKRLQKALKKRGLTCMELAERSGCTKQNISLYMTEKSFPSLKSAVAMAKALNVSLDELFGVTIEVSPDAEL